MLKTSIIIKNDDDGTEWYPYDGLATSLGIAIWLFAFCGWQKYGSAYPDLIYLIEEGEWPEEEELFEKDATELWILGACLYMN